MLESLVHLDQQLLLLLNGSDSVYWDGFWVSITRVATWIFFYLFLLLVLLRSYDYRRVGLIVLMVGVAILLADQGASGICKPLVQRFRPSHEPALAGLVDLVDGRRGGLYGFFSSHAANTASVAVFVSLLARRRVCYAVLATWVLLNCWTRVYLGVHYVGDLLCGLLCGVLVGWSVNLALRRWVSSYRASLPFSDFESHLLTLSFLFTTLFVSLFSFAYAA